MSTRTFTSVPTWLVGHQAKTLAELEGETIGRAEALRRLQLASWLANRFMHNSGNPQEKT